MMQVKIDEFACGKSKLTEKIDKYQELGYLVEVGIKSMETDWRHDKEPIYTLFIFRVSEEQEETTNE